MAKKKLFKTRTMKSVAALVGCMCLTLAAGIVLTACGGSNDEIFTNPYGSKTLVGYSAEYLGTAERRIPERTHDEGLPEYPKYGYTLKSVIGTSAEKVAARNALISESWVLSSVNTRIGSDGFPKNTYNKIGADGKLYLNGEDTGKTLYKHTAAVGMYEGDVADTEQAIIKKITWRPRGYTGYGITGLYAPAGEVIKFEMTAADMDATGGVQVHIGQALYNGKANNIWQAKNQMQRMPVIMNTLNVDKTTAEYDESRGVYTAYIGSFWGGPIYVRNENVTFSATISGAVRYRHLIHGYTTPEEFEENAASTAPYFDLEVWEYGVLHSGPLKYAKAFDFDNLYKAAVLWEKISLVSTQRSRQGIVFLYDPFVAAGAAVAFPGQGAVNCPSGWMSNSLNYNSITTSGAWGNLHEYNHNFQGYGVGSGGEVTNNALTLVSYSLFTKISSARGIGNYGAFGLSGWNQYTCASWALSQVTEGLYSNGKYGLAIYANLLHNFGQDAFIAMTKNSGGQSVDTWFNACMNVTHYDMTYYYNELIGYPVSGTVLDNAASKNYPMFVPAASVYQTGRTFVYDGETREVQTMRPYKIKYGEPFTVDLSPYKTEGGQYVSGSVILPRGFTYKVKSVSQPEHGNIAKTDNDYIYTFTPDSNSRSGKIKVTLEVTKTEGNIFDVQDIELLLEFEQSHEMNKYTLERSTYTYEAGSVPASATAAYESGYAGASVVSGDSINALQNSNTDVWYTYENPAPDNTVVEVKGKLYAEEEGKYRIALRGRWDIALYASLDGKEYHLVGASVTDRDKQMGTGNYFMNGANFVEACPYEDYTLEAGSWVYFKAVMKCDRRVNKLSSYIGVGWGKFIPEQGILDENNNVVGYAPERVSVSYASAYRSDYEFTVEDFEPDYEYLREYSYSYMDETEYSTYDKAGDGEEYEVKLLSDLKYGWECKPENMFDGNSGTYYHSNTGVNNQPVAVIIDMGRPIAANSMTVISRNTQPGAPKVFTLSVSDNGTDWRTVGSYSGYADGSKSVVAQFELTTFRYFNLYVTDTTYNVSGNKFLIISEIRFSESHSVLNGKLISPDDDMLTFKGDWRVEQKPSSFGHVFVGEKKAKLEFTFTGKRLAILSSSAFDIDYKVYIDGDRVDSVELAEPNGDIVAGFVSEEFEEGEHTVEIVCKGETSIDSIVIW